MPELLQTIQTYYGSLRGSFITGLLIFSPLLFPLLVVLLVLGLLFILVLAVLVLVFLVARVSALVLAIGFSILLVVGESGENGRRWSCSFSGGGGLSAWQRRGPIGGGGTCMRR